MKDCKKIYFLVFLSLSVLRSAWGQADYPWLRVGDELFLKGAFTDAELAYRKALEEKDKPATTYNLGNTVYNQNRIPEAIQQYQKAIESTRDPELKSKSYYNLGNAHFQNQEFEESINAYKESLKLQPNDEDAKKNLMLAMRQFQQQQQQKQQQEQQENKENQEDKNQDQQQQSSSDQSDKKEQDPSSSSQDPSEPNEEQQKSPEDLSQEEAREILKAIEREDQRVQEKLKKVAGKSAPPVKDW